VQPGLVATVFGLVFVAELPDKTMIATLVLGSRYRPLLVWIGATLAFGCHALLAVAAGQLLHLLPHRWVEVVTTVLFAAGAAYLFLVPEREEEAAGERDASRAREGGMTLVTAFTVIVVGEFGDLTQILTANLAARTHEPASVFVGAFAALATVAALGAFAGRALLRFVPLETVRKVGALLLAALAVYSLVTLLTG
jgi:Ca2+/H+ antiporter, TMEM165/GDT1 family